MKQTPLVIPKFDDYGFRAALSYGLSCPLSLLPEIFCQRSSSRGLLSWRVGKEIGKGRKESGKEEGGRKGKGWLTLTHKSFLWLFFVWRAHIAPEWAFSTTYWCSHTGVLKVHHKNSLTHFFTPHPPLDIIAPPFDREGNSLKHLLLAIWQVPRPNPSNSKNGMTFDDLFFFF